MYTSLNDFGSFKRISEVHKIFRSMGPFIETDLQGQRQPKVAEWTEKDLIYAQARTFAKGIRIWREVGKYLPTIIISSRTCISCVREIASGRHERLLRKCAQHR
ncbi:hypothetical protein CDAR_15771 [Caerostris darwini]|uniref:Uncharacterized protein n=1 Tax=Caerostris darwini TaxID=1538125 RepID=A0AAV4N806_9ARAC|nr:hypothetical protein CDAR_15771 [Caerostris darwini]